MQHIKPMKKGDLLCPLGFHPQVRWPTRCKRCFRDYKEHGNRNKEQDYKLKWTDTAASSPSLDSWKNKSKEDKNISSTIKRSWTSTSNLHEEVTQPPKTYEPNNSNKTTSSWTSTPDLVQLCADTRANGDVINVTLPRRKKPAIEIDSDDDYRRTAYTVRRRTSSGLSAKPTMPESSSRDVVPKSRTETFNHVSNAEPRTFYLDSKDETESDIFADATSSVNTDDTDSTVHNGLLEGRIESLKVELRNMKIRYEKAEKEKNEILSRRTTLSDTSVSTKATGSELSRLQEKVNNLTATCENLKEEKKSLTNRIFELESKKSAKDTDTDIYTLKSKLRAAESLCEELMDENTEMKKELRDMEEEIEEMQDNFRENQEDEYSSIKKELEQTGKNCRILSFKLRKSERKAEQLEAEKVESERKSREAIQKLQKELDEVNEKVRLNAVENARKKAPMLGNIPKTPSGEKVSRASLTRGGSQEDPAQLLRDLQDSIEREADLREQLRYAEEEAQNLRKKVSRVEDDNESLLMQLKKMATKAKSRKLSPSHSRSSNELPIEKDEGISDDDDPTELRLLLELNEQESAVLRKKVEELEENCDILKRKASDLQEKLLAKEQKPSRNFKQKDTAKNSDDEIIQELKTKLKDKENECDQLKTELNSSKKKSKNVAKTRLGEADVDNIDLQRQLKVVEQEANVLRARISSLESENEKLSNENRQLNIAKMSKKLGTPTEANLKNKIVSLEKQLADVRKLRPKESADKSSQQIKELKDKCSFLESENARLAASLLLLKGNTDEIKEYYKKRTPKIVTDSTPRNALKKMVEDLECEIKDILLSQEKLYTDYKKSVQTDSPSSDVKRLTLELETTKEIAEVEKKKLTSEVNELRQQIINMNEELKKTQCSQKETSNLLVTSQRSAEEKAATIETLQRQLQNLQILTKGDGKLKFEVAEKNRKILDLEKKVQEHEEKIKKSERLVQAKKDKILNLEKELENMKKENQIKTAENAEGNDDNVAKIEELKKLINEKIDEIQEKQSRINDLEMLLSSKSGANPPNNVRVTELETKLLGAQKIIKKLTENVKLLENEKKSAEEAAQIMSDNLKMEISVLKTNAERLQTDFESERTLMNQFNDEQKKQLLCKDTELKLLKKKILNADDKKINALKKDFESKLQELKTNVDRKQREYEELTNKYELLEDEHVKLKSQSNLQKEQMQSQVSCTQKELISVQNELRTLRETYNSRQDNWIKEKLRLEEKIKDLENHALSNETHKMEYNKLKLMVEVKESEIYQLQKGNRVHIDQMELLKKKNEELQKKLDETDTVAKVQGNKMAESSSLESELKELRAKLRNEEQGWKVETAALKLRYENQIAALSNELKDVQSQLMRFKQERNTYKHLLENAQKVTAEVKANPDLITKDTSNSNDLEDEKLQHSGRTKSTGLKTRTELSWEKEREEQNRLLQETSTLARDLRQTLFEAEREHDKERLDMKRKLDQIKKNAEEEQEETKKKLHELQCDLLELRDAHAKLRTTNEKLRREKEKFDREREIRQNWQENDQKKISYILDLINDLSKTVPYDRGLPPIPTKKLNTARSRESSIEKRNLSRESSLAREDPNSQFHQIVQKLIDIGQQVKVNASNTTPLFGREAARRAFISRRPASTESDKPNEIFSGLQRRGSLYRKCVSLEQTSPIAENYQPIWRTDDTNGSVGSIQSVDSYSQKMNHKFDPSFDSRLSGGSTHSEMLPSTLEKKKKKGILGKLKKLTKSARSVDRESDPLPSNYSNGGNPGSNSSISSIIPDQEFASKRDLKGRISNLFKISDPSRSHSMERSSENYESIEVPHELTEKVTASQTLPRRSVSSSTKTDRQICSESNSGGATMPRSSYSKKTKN